MNWRSYIKSTSTLWLIMAALILVTISTVADPQTQAPPMNQTIQMSWKRGDSHYGPNFIHPESPCLSNADSKCYCAMDFKAVNSKEFADYVESFGARKVPVTFEVSYDPGGKVAGARLLQVGNWSRDKFSENDALLGEGARFSREQRTSPANHFKFRNPGDCFALLKNNRDNEH